MTQNSRNGSIDDMDKNISNTSRKPSNTENDANPPRISLEHILPITLNHNCSQKHCYIYILYIYMYTSYLLRDS